MDGRITLTVIVPVYNRLDEVIDLLESAEHLDFRRSDFELLFVDDGSSDGLIEYLQSYDSPSGLRIRFLAREPRPKHGSQ